ncbi:restriction endonuclease subunit S [Aeromonas hydrophila]|uniref:restriction endonuclease subunit S n=1 Tax=Aeromonas hydrophila TaxID=644 RepID=UPI0022AFBA01|nr:restriction endonuclease subunit S [Aeromonas hydrophila]MCZ4331790.1 restriction endonuclease subunit S [Aeromonas hydrophila]
MSKLSEHVYPLGRLGDLVRGFRGVTYKPDDLRTIADEHTAVLLRSNNIQESYLNFEDIQIVPTSIVSEQQVLDKGDIAVCMSNGSRQLVGKSGIYDGSYSNKLTVGAFCSIFRCFCEDDADYVRYLFQSQEYQHSIDILLAGSAINNLKNSDVESILLPIAPKENRAKIAEILGNLDRYIQTVVASIDKLNAIKQGMMTDLFSRGIDPATGHLRPSFHDAPEFYYHTPLGPAPKGWEYGLLKRFVRVAEYGISTSLDEDVTGIPVLRMNNIQNNRFDVSDLKYTKEPDAYRLKLRKGDVLYNRTNSMEHVGKTALWREELEECSFASYLVRLNLHEDQLRPAYFSHWMSQESSQNALRAFATPAVQQVNINPTNLQRVEICCPGDPHEQDLIVERIDALDDNIAAESMNRMKLQEQKAGLMRDLLTGKVPVSA